MSRAKRKVEEVGELLLSAAVGDVFSRTVSAAVGRCAAHAGVDEQIEHLGMLVMILHSVVEAAEGVHIRSWWLRRWFWRLRDAALDGDEVLRSSLTSQRRQQQKADEEAAAAGGGRRLWNVAKRVLRSAKSFLLTGGDDSAARLSAAVARLERVSMGLAEFLKMLDMEIRRPQEPARILSFQGPDACDPGRSVVVRKRKAPCSRPWSTEEILHGVLDVPPPPPPNCSRGDFVCGSSDDEEESWKPSTREEIHGVLGKPPRRCRGTTVRCDDGDVDGGSSDEESLEYSSSLGGAQYKEHNAARRKFVLLIVWHNIRRAMNRLTTRTSAPPPASSDDLSTTLYHPVRLCALVGDIRRALRASDLPEVHGKMWLAEWRRELQGLADRADRVLIPVSEAVVAEFGVAAASVNVIGDDEVMRTVQSVHTAAAHLECFVTLARLAVSRGIPTA
ncbi:unnamed protein product [Urochloa humidicola]